MLELRCPKCRKTMMYHSIRETKNEPVKRCVFCGRSFTVKNCIERRVEERIIKNKIEKNIFVTY